MPQKEPISYLDWNNYLSIVDAGHVNYPLPPGSLDGLSSETMSIDRFDGHAPSGGYTMFPLQLRPLSQSPHIEKAHSAQGLSASSPITSSELEHHIPAGLDTGISSVDTEFFGRDGVSNSGGASCHSTEPSLGQSPSHRIVHLMQGVRGPLVEITLLFFVEWQEYLPGGLSLNSEHVCGVEVKGKTLIWKDGLMHELLQLPCVAENLLQDATMGRARLIIDESLGQRRYLAFSIRTATVDLYSAPATIPAHFSRCVPETILYLEAQELNACSDSRGEKTWRFSVARSNYELDSYQSTASCLERSSRGLERRGSFNTETLSTKTADRLNVNHAELHEINELISGLSSRVYSEPGYRPSTTEELYRQVLKRVNGRECRDVLSKWLETMGRRKRSPYLKRPDFWPEWIPYTAPTNLTSDRTKDIMLFILCGEHGCKVPFEKLNEALEEVRHIKPKNRERLRDMISIRSAEFSRPDAPFSMFHLTRAIFLN